MSEQYWEKQYDLAEIAEAVQTCRDAHYYIMRTTNFWYDVAAQEASKLLCVAASDLRLQLKS